MTVTRFDSACPLNHVCRIEVGTCAIETGDVSAAQVLAAVKRADADARGSTHVLMDLHDYRLLRAAAIRHYDDPDRVLVLKRIIRYMKRQLERR